MNPVNQNLKASPRLIAGLKTYEQFVGFTYDDAHFPPRPFTGGQPDGTLTIGFGHTEAAGAPIPRAGATIAEDEAEGVLFKDLVPYENDVKRLVDVRLTQGQFDALVDFQFNTGALAKSTLLKKLNRGDYASVPAEFMKWTKSGGRELAGLVKRRRFDCELWRGLSPVDYTSARVAVDRPTGRKITQSREANTAVVVSALGGLEVFNTVNEQISTITAQVEQAKDTYEAARGLLPVVTDMKLLVPLLIVMAGVAIYLWRRSRIIEDAN